MYSSIHNEKIKEIKKLHTKKYRDQMNLFLVEGKNLVLEAYKNNYLKEVIVLENTDLKIDVNTIIVSEKVMRYISELDTINKVIGVCYKKKEKDIKGKVLILDNIQDPGNLGTIIRSSVAFDIDTIILSEDTVDLYNQKVLRGTQGLLFNINILVSDIKKEIINLKNDGYLIFGTKIDNGENIKNIIKPSKYAIIVGNEGNGIKDEILNLCDKYIKIDMNTKCESLNVGVAASIILYEMR